MADDTTSSAQAAEAAEAPEAPEAPASVPAPPAIVVHGAATPEQVAALVAVLSAASGGDAPAGDAPASTWAAHAAAMRHPLSHGPAAWRTSLRS
jgi:hypothetical protein